MGRLIPVIRHVESKMNRPFTGSVQYGLSAEGGTFGSAIMRFDCQLLGGISLVNLAQRGFT
jgi:hypothetical protein